MDLDVALPRFRDALAPGAVVAIVDTENVHGPYRDEVLGVIKEHSEIEHHEGTKDLVDRLRATGRFIVEGEEWTEPEPFEQTVDDYIEFLHSTSTLARVRLGQRSSGFDRKLRAIFTGHGMERLRYDVVGFVAWGRPR